MPTPGHEKILAVIPAFNEAGKVGRVVEKISRTGAVDGIVAVDDCSTDATSEEAASSGAVVIRHEKNMGVGAAIRSGIRYGLENGFDICVILSGDDQHEPQEIERVTASIREGRCDFVQGSRRLKGGNVVNDRPFRKFATQSFSLFFSLVARRRITDATNGFRAFRLTLFDDPDIDIDQDWLDRYELEPYILFKAVKSKKVRAIEVPITIYYHGNRKAFTKMKPFRDWWRIAKPLCYLALGLRK